MGDDRPVRSYDVVTSVEAMASSWARREHAPDGAAVVALNEVAGRLRGGEPWRRGGGDGLMLAVVVRPEIDPLQEALLWLSASLAAVDGLEALTDAPVELVWPDRVVEQATSVPRCHVNVVVQLGPGRVEHAVFALRADLSEGTTDDPDVDEVVASFARAAQRSVRQLRDDPNQILDQYIDRCCLVGRRVLVELLPRGEARGRVAAIDADGFLVLESATGMLERVAPASLRSIEVVGE